MGLRTYVEVLYWKSCGKIGTPSCLILNETPIGESDNIRYNREYMIAFTLLKVILEMIDMHYGGCKGSFHYYSGIRKHAINRSRHKSPSGLAAVVTDSDE